VILICGLPPVPDPRDLAGFEADAVALTAGERRRARRRVVTRAGRILALALPAGDVLTPGRVLHVGPGWYVAVEAAPEALLAITPRTPRQGLRIAQEVGRLHAALAVDGRRLLVPDEPAVERLLQRLGVGWVRAHEPFVPVSSGSPH